MKLDYKIVISRDIKFRFSNVGNANTVKCGVTYICESNKKIGYGQIDKPVL